MRKVVIKTIDPATQTYEKRRTDCNWNIPGNIDTGAIVVESFSTLRNATRIAGESIMKNVFYLLSIDKLGTYSHFSSSGPEMMMQQSNCLLTEHVASIGLWTQNIISKLKKLMLQKHIGPRSASTSRNIILGLIPSNVEYIDLRPLDLGPLVCYYTVEKFIVQD